MARPKCLMGDFTDLHRIYKAHHTNVQWTMKVFCLHWKYCLILSQGVSNAEWTFKDLDRGSLDQVRSGIRSVPWLQMSWLLKSPGHQQPWHWLCMINILLSPIRKDFNNPCHLSFDKTDVKRRQTLGHPRSINPNMINHVPQQLPIIF